MVFGKIVKKLQLPGVYSEAALEALSRSGVKLSTATGSSMEPGDLVTFSYKGFLTSRRVLIVDTDRGSNGKFMSGRGNYLVCGYDLTGSETLPTIVMILNSFYKNNKIAYKNMKSTMNQVFGINRFKTFDTKFVKSAFDITFK